MMEISEELAYLLGVLRDGTIQIGKNKYGTFYYLEFMSKSKEWLENLANLLQKLCQKRPTVRSITKNGKHYWRLRLRNKKFILKLTKFANFTAPQWKWNLSPNLISKNKISYVAGFFDAEGYISKSSTTNAWNIGIEHTWKNNKSCPPLQTLKEILATYQIKSNRITVKEKWRKRPLFCLRISEKTSIIRFCELIRRKSLHPEKIKKIELILHSFHTKVP